MKGDSGPHPEARERARRLIETIYPILIVVAGIVLVIFALVPSVERVGEASFTGTASTGDTSTPVLQAGHSSAIFTYEDIPCPLFVYVLDDVEHASYLEGGSLPLRILDCDIDSLAVDIEVSYLVFRNVDPDTSLNYSFSAEFFRVRQTLLWLSLPAVSLLLVGSVILIVRMLVRGIEQISEELMSREEPRTKRRK